MKIGSCGFSGWTLGWKQDHSSKYLPKLSLLRIQIHFCIIQQDILQASVNNCSMSIQGNNYLL